METILNFLAVTVVAGVITGVLAYVALLTFWTTVYSVRNFKRGRILARELKEQELSPYERTLLNIKKLEAELDFETVWCPTDKPAR
jgi:hypothetical protein